MAKYVLITGGTKGIGFSVAKCFAKMGYDLLLTYATDTIIAQKVKNELFRDFGVEVAVLPADSTDKKSIGVIAHHIENRGRKLDTLVFNAGITCRDRLEEIDFASWERVFYANVHFPVFLLQRLLGNINAGASVIFTGSLMGIHPHGTSLPYGVSKSAVHALVRNLVKYLAPYDIRVNGVAPGFVDTEWQKCKPEEVRRSIESKISLNRFCTPDELADVYKLLVENTYFNGEVIVVDGGYSYK